MVDAPLDLIHDTSVTTGTGNLTLVAVNGKVRFGDATDGYGTGGTDKFVYYASSRDNAEWEQGTGHCSDINTLVRDTVVASSNSDALVSFSAGTMDVTSDVPGVRRANIALGVLGITIDGGGSAISTGVKGYLEVPFNCTIQQVTMTADVSGSAVVDIWKDSYANYPPVDEDSITASAVPTISTAVKSQDGTLTGWTTAITAGDILGFNVDSASTITLLTLTLEVLKT